MMARLGTKLKCPLLLVSYESAIQRPELYVRSVADFTGVSDATTIRSAIGKIKANTG